MGKKVLYKDIEGFPGFRVRSDGFVESCWERYWEKGVRGCKSRMTSRWHKLTGAPDEGGYLMVTLRNGKVQKTAKVATLVLTAFKGPKPPNKDVAAHYPKKNKNNNHIDNLMWATYQENSDHKYEQDSIGFGEDAPKVYMDEERVHALRADRLVGMTYTELSAKYNISVSQVGNIVKGTSWLKLKLPPLD